MGRVLKEDNGTWAVHENVSEKEEAITPRFKSKDNLIIHLSMQGTEWDDPWTLEEAEHFVNKAGWAPSDKFDEYGFRKGYQLP